MKWIAIAFIIFAHPFIQAKEAFAKLATAICEVPAKDRASISTKPIVVTMGEERSELCTSRHEQSAVASFAKASKEAKPVFRALVACDMASQDIRKGSRSDLVRVKKSFVAIAKQLGITPKITVLKGKKFAVKNVSKWLSTIPDHSNDIIFFYYSGHGGRTPTLPDPWPIMIFPQKNRPSKAEALVGGNIYRYLARKNPRLSIIMFDSCNNIVQRKDAEAASQSLTPILSSHSRLPGLKALFLKTRGIITSCAAKPGETAVTTVHGKVTGGIFTTGFLFAIKKLAARSNTKWKDVFSRASSYCLKYYNGRQHPVYTIETTAQ